MIFRVNIVENFLWAIQACNSVVVIFSTQTVKTSQLTSTNSDCDILPSWFSSISLKAKGEKLNRRESYIRTFLEVSVNVNLTENCGCLHTVDTGHQYFTGTWLHKNLLTCFIGIGFIYKKKQISDNFLKLLCSIEVLYNKYLDLDRDQPHLQCDFAVVIDIKNPKYLLQILLWSPIGHDVENYHKLTKVNVSILKIVNTRRLMCH